MRTPEAVAGMLCPVCKVALHMSDRQGIEIDYCPQCRGIWLDRGELDKIIERSAVQAAPAAPLREPQARYDGRPQQYDGRQHQGGQHPHKRRKSFFEELFD